MTVRRSASRCVLALAIALGSTRAASAAPSNVSVPVPVGACAAARFGSPAILPFGKDLLVAIVGDDCGSVSLLDGRTGAERRRLDNPLQGAFHVENGPGFGAALGALGRRVLVAAPNDRTVYAIDAHTGKTLQRYLATGPTHDGFGEPLVGVGRHVVVGAMLAGLTGPDVRTYGGVYAYDAASGRLDHEITPPPSSHAHGFGARVAALSHDRVAIGTIEGAEGVPAHVFVADVRDGTVPLTIMPPTPTGVDSYGLDVAASGDVVVVGIAQPAGPTPTGTVYVYDARTGELRRTIASPGAPGEAFGQAIAIRGHVLLVGAPSGTDVNVPGSLYAIDARTGRIRGRLALGTDVAPGSVLPPAFLRRGLAFAVEPDATSGGALHVDYRRLPRS